MFNLNRLKNVLVAYKQDFVSKQWGEEKYKWEAVKWFQDTWDVNASDFAEMLSRSLDKTFNLLASINNFPKGMILDFAKSAPEEVRAMFIALFDESKDVLVGKSIVIFRSFTINDFAADGDSESESPSAILQLKNACRVHKISLLTL